MPSPTPDLSFWRFVDRPEQGCWEWCGEFSKDGYGEARQARLPDGERRAHRASWKLVHGAIASGLYVCHRCDNPKCVRPEHLFLGTQQDNVRDAMAKGRHVCTRQTGKKRGPYRHAVA